MSIYKQDDKETSKRAIYSFVFLFIAGVGFAFLKYCSESLWGLFVGCFLASGLLVSFFLGLWGLIEISFNRKELKGYCLVLASICISGFAIAYIAMSFYLNTQEAECHTRIGRGLYLATYQYSYEINDGYWLEANEWCDAIRDNGYNGTFKCPSGKDEICSYAFNKNISGMSMKDIPNGVVLLFEAEGDLNLNGTSELIKMRHGWWWGRYTHVVLTGPEIIKCKKGDINQLRWEP